MAGDLIPSHQLHIKFIQFYIFLSLAQSVQNTIR